MATEPSAIPITLSTAISDKCCICGCTPDHACVVTDIETFEITRCTWVNVSRTLCSNLDCISKYEQILASIVSGIYTNINDEV